MNRQQSGLQHRLMQTLGAFVIGATLTAPISAQVMDSGYQSHIIPQTTTREATRTTTGSSTANATPSALSRRRPVRPVPSYLIPPTDNLRLIIANPSDKAIEATLFPLGTTTPTATITIPPKQLYVDEDLCDTNGCAAPQTLATTGVVLMKETVFNDKPAGIAGHMLDMRPRGTPGPHYFPLPTDTGRTMDVTILNAWGKDVPIADVTISRGARSYSPAYGPVPQGQEVTFTDVARDDRDGFITGVPGGEVYLGTGFISAQAAATLASRTIVRNKTNKDTYSVAADNQYVAWGVFLGLGNETPLDKPANHPNDVVARSRVQVHFAKGGAMETIISLRAVDLAGNDATAQTGIFAGKDMTFQTPYRGTHSAMEVKVLSGQQQLLLYGHTDIMDGRVAMKHSLNATTSIEAIVASERTPMLTYTDMIGGNAIGVAPGVGNTIGAMTFINAYAATYENPVGFRISVLDDRGTLIGSKDYALQPGEYQRFPLTDIIGESEVAYGTAIYTPLYGFGLASFERTDRGGGDSITSKFVKTMK